MCKCSLRLVPHLITTQITVRKEAQPPKGPNRNHGARATGDEEDAERRTKRSKGMRQTIAQTPTVRCGSRRRASNMHLGRREEPSVSKRERTRNRANPNIPYSSARVVRHQQKTHEQIAQVG